MIVDVGPSVCEIDWLQCDWLLLHRVIEERVRNQEWSGRVKDTREKMNKLYDENRSSLNILQFKPWKFHLADTW